MSSNLVFNIFGLIFLSFNSASNAFPILPLSLSGTPVSGTPLVSDAPLSVSSLVSAAGASLGGASLVSNADLVVDPSSAQMILPKDFVVPEGMFGPTMLQEVPMTEIVPGYNKAVKGLSAKASKMKSYLPKNPFKGLFKPKEEFIIVEDEPKKLTIDPRLIKIASSAVGALFPNGKASASAGIGAAVGAPIGAVMGAKAGAVKGAQVGKALAKQKVEISKKITEVASEFKSKSIAAGKATFNKAVSKITVSPTDIKIKEKVSVKIEKPKSLEATMKVQHPIVGDQFARIKLETVQPKSTKGSH